jgi:hypothetical protein
MKLENGNLIVKMILKLITLCEVNSKKC